MKSDKITQIIHLFMLSARSEKLSDVKMTSVHCEGNILSTSIQTDENNITEKNDPEIDIK